MKNDLVLIAKKFLYNYHIVSIEPLGNGLINDTFVVKGSNDSGSTNIVLQKINHEIYKEPSLLIENHLALTAHGNQNHNTKIISDLIRTQDNEHYSVSNGEYWRAQNYIENSISYDVVLDENIAVEAATLIGKFHSYFFDSKNLTLRRPLNNFHHLPFHLDSLEENLQQNTYKRLSNCQFETEAILNLKSQMSDWYLRSQQLPDRICHYDTKINNFLFDKSGKKATHLIDLDNVMFGKIIFDFGDMMRTFIPSVDENEQDLSKIQFRLKIAKVLIKVYLSSMNSLLIEEERTMLIIGGLLITYEQSIRFLCDYLNGDQYYKTQYESHNLVRAQNQIQLLNIFLDKKIELEKIVELS